MNVAAEKLPQLNPTIFNLDARVVYFPVRHHSPSAGLILRRLVKEMKPKAILIEGPSHFNDRIEELYLPHKLPIAIYCFARSKEGARRGAFYPFCVYSPEWQALQCAKETKAKAAFIDLPWREMALVSKRAHRYSDGELHEDRYVDAVCRKLGVEDFNGLWDRLVEIDNDLSIKEYFERCHRLCYNMRHSREEIAHEDDARERFMASQVRKCMNEIDGKILVVTGGFHSHAIMELVNDPNANLELSLLSLAQGQDSSEQAPSQGIDEDKEGALEVEEDSYDDENDDEDLEDLAISQADDDEVVDGIALTPYSYERLDALTGYEAGMPGPGFYHQVFVDRNWDNSDATYRKILFKAAEELRKKKQQVSAADLIALESTAKNLARLRGQKTVWRLDLIDAIMATLVKDALYYEMRHPMLEAIYAVFRGKERGRLADEAPLPPLVLDIRRQLEAHKIQPEDNPKQITLSLHKRDELQTSQVLHQIGGLGITGFGLYSTAELMGDDEGRIEEIWEYKWSPDFDATCIEASIFGTSLKEAAANRLTETARFSDLNSADAAKLLSDACLMGLSDISETLYERLRVLIGKEPQFDLAANAGKRLLHLYYYDQVLETKPTQKIAALLVEAFDRSLWLLEMLGQVGDEAKLIIQAIRHLVEIYERGRKSLPIDQQNFFDVFRRSRADNAQSPPVRGALTGALWTLGDADEEQIVQDLIYFADPAKLGDFLNGLFSLAREVIQRRPSLVKQIDVLLMSYEDEEFLTAAPSMRLAFASFTPREKHHIAENLMRLLGAKTSQPLADLAVDFETAERVIALESRVKQVITKYGLRGPDGE